MIALLRRPIVSTGLCLLFFLKGFAQYDGSVPQVSTITPNAAALFKISQRPVGNYTGTTPISLPLYAVKAGSLEVPVSMNYANGGIRVEEIASWVGLGWNLSAGGRITRAKNGVADDDANHGGMLHAALKPSGFPGTPWLPNIGYILTGDLDMEPDMFYFDCNGISGKFFFDESGNVRLVSQQALKIAPVYNGFTIESWVITDDKGIKYYFGYGVVDQTSISYSSIGGYPTPPSPSYISSWHLVKVEDMNTEQTITLSYTRNWTQFETLSGAYVRISGMTGFDCLPSDSYGDEMLVTNITDEYYLTKIEGGNDSLLLHSSANRSDFSGGRRLDSISLYAKNNQLRKRHHFQYDYFSKYGDPTGIVYDTYYKRLKLNKVSEFGTAANDSLTHSFEYVDTEQLPSRFSRGTDYWGYYNGQDYNWTFMPNGNYQDGIYTYRIDSYGDRRSNPYYSNAGTLKKITYPTGGSREFVYEGNTALLEYGTQIQPDASYYTPQNFYEDNFYFWDPYTPAATHNFSVNSTEGTVNLSFYLHTSGYYGDSEVKIIRIINPWTEFEVMNFVGQLGGDYVLPNGDYRIEVYHGYSSYIYAIECNWQEQSLSNNVVYRYNSTYTDNIMNVGGIRVKELKDYDPVSGKTNSTKYKYNLFSDTTLTSGLLISPVRVAHVGGCQPMNRDCQYIRLSSQSAYPLATEGGSYVVYPEVRTIEDGNGYTDREYTFAFDTEPSTIQITDFPILPPFDASWLRNKLQFERVYNNSNQLIKETYVAGNGWDGLPTYSPYFMFQTQLGWKVVGYYGGHVCGTGILCNGCWGQYTLQSQFTNVRTHKERIFNAGGTAQDLLTEYDYYTNLSMPVLKEQRVYLNNGAVKKTSYKYAFNSTGDFVFGLTTPEQTMKTALLNNHYLQPLEVSTTVTPSGGSPTLTEGAKFSFGTFNGSSLHLANLKRYSSLTDYKETIFSAYDVKGNLQEKYEPGGAKEVYLWGYLKNYPVAKITGSDYSTVSAWVTPSVLDNPANDAALRTHLNTVRTNLAGSAAQVTSYTYSPLKGMTSATDAKGVNVFYEYDHFMRLKNLKDQDGKVLKSYQYHYKP